MESHEFTMQDQTDPRHLKEGLVEAAQPGVGLFLVGRPDDKDKKFEKVVIEGLSYEECKERGRYCVYFKWFPQSAMTFAALKEALSDPNKPCGNLGCGSYITCNSHCFCDLYPNPRAGRCI